MLISTPVFKELDLIDYADSYQMMLNHIDNFTNHDKDAVFNDEFWFLEHNSVFTLGLRAHKDFQGIDSIQDIPVVKSDRGGLITYHGPGQLTIYSLCKVESKQVKNFVEFLEEVIIQTLSKFDIQANRREGMPGVYTGVDKIASIGLRVKNGMTYHGVSLNVNMDITPFTWISPCGFDGLQMSQISDFIPNIQMDLVREKLSETIVELTSN